LRARSPSVVSEATAEEKLVGSSESAAVAFDTNLKEAAGEPKAQYYAVTWNAALETGGILIGDEVTITLDVEFVKA